MRITGIEAENWLCHERVKAQFSPLAIIAGPNGAGKSALLNAVGFVLTGKAARVSKADRNPLIREGQREGWVRLDVCDDGAGQSGYLTRDIATAKVTGKSHIGFENAVTTALPFVLDASAFARLSPMDRRAALLEVMRVDLSLTGIATALQERMDQGEPAHDPALIDQLPIQEKESVATWLATATRLAAEARGAWKHIAGETYGSVKAASWRAPAAPKPTAERIEALLRHEEECHQALADADRRATLARGGAQATVLAAAARERLEATVAAGAGKRAFADKAAKGIERGRKALRDAEMDLDAMKVAPWLTCPHCGGAVDLKDGELHDHVLPANVPTEAEIQERRAARDKISADLDTLINNHKAAEALARAAEAASTALADMGESEPVETADDIEALQAAAAAAKDALIKASTNVATEQSARTARSVAEARTRDAAAAHKAVEGWSKIAEDLKPDGIPGALLGRAMHTFNSALASLSAQAKWPQVQIQGDMDITFGGRPYQLLSESEMWRADATIALAIAQASCFRFALIDRFDVLDLPSRGNALGFLHGLVNSMDLDGVIVAGTLKATPAVPKGVSVHWLGAAQAQAS